MDIDKIKLGTKLGFSQYGDMNLVGIVIDITYGTTFTMMFKEPNPDNTRGWEVSSSDMGRGFTKPSWFESTVCGGWNISEDDILKIYE